MARLPAHLLVQYLFAGAWGQELLLHGCLTGARRGYQREPSWAVGPKILNKVACCSMKSINVSGYSHMFTSLKISPTLARIQFGNRPGKPLTRITASADRSMSLTSGTEVSVVSVNLDKWHLGATRHMRKHMYRKHADVHTEFDVQLRPVVIRYPSSYKHIYIYIYMYMCINILYIYIYMYILHIYI